MPVTKPVIKLDEGGSGNASTTVSGNNSSVSGGYNFSPDSPFYASAQRLAESKRKKEEEEKRKTDEKNAQYFSSNIQSFVKTVNDVSGHIGKAIGSWAPQQTVSDSIGMYDSLSENYKKLQDAFVGNDYLRESMSEEDYKKTSEAMDAIGKALEDGTAYVRQAGEVYGQFGNADEYNRHVQLSGMSAENLQKMVDSLDAEREAREKSPASYETTLIAGDRVEIPTKAYEQFLKDSDAERVLYTSYLNNAKYNEGVKKYGVDPKNMTYSEIMGIVNSQAAYRRNPDVYDFVRSFYDSQNENYWYGKKAEEFVDGLDAHERYLYKKVADLLGTNGSAGVSVSGAAPARVSNTAKVNELTKEISERTGESEDVVKQNIQMAQWVFDAQNRAEQQEKISEYVSANAGNAALANAGSVLINLPAGVAAFLDQTGQTVGNKLNGTDAPVNPNTPGQSLLNVSNDIRDATRKQIEKKVSAKLPTGANLGVFAYDTLMSTADVVAQTLVGGVVGRGIGSALGLGADGINKAISATTGMIASSTAAANTVQESLEDGYSNGMSVARGAIAGAIESIVEAVQIDRLLKGLSGGDSAIKAVLKGALSEGTEEVVTNILTEDLVEFFFGNGARISRLTAEYEAAGYSKEGALRKAALDVIGQDAETFVSAAITGAVFGGTEAAATRANDKANTKLAQDGINNRIGGIGEIEFLKAVNGEMVSAAEEFNRTHNDAQYKAVDDEVLRRIAYIQSVKEDIQNNSSLRNVIGESGIQQEIQKLDANVQTLSEIRSLIEPGRYDPSYQAELISAKEEDLTKTTEEQAKSQRNVLKAAQMYLSAFGSEKKAVEAAKKTAAQENARAAELSAERNRLTQALATADETQKVEINRRIQEIGREIKRTARNVIRAGKVEKALGDQYRSAINSALGGNEKELSKRLTNALGREVKVAYDDNAKGFSSMKTGADSSTLTVNPELILRTENALRQEFGEEYTGNLAKEKLVHEIAHAAARSDANFDAKVLEIYHLLRDNGLITDDDIDEAATREAYKDTLKRYMATEPAKAEVRRLVEAGNAEADAIAAVENAYIGEELVAQTLEWMERATNGQLSREILGEKRNVFVQALNRIAEIFRSVAAKLKGVDNVNAAKTAGFADKIERFAREFAERGVAEMNGGNAAVSQESAGAVQSAGNAQGNSGEGAVASSESESTTGTQEEDERQSINVSFAKDINEWSRDGMPSGESFVLGVTGDVLQGLGAIENDIYMKGDKIRSILENHQEMSIDTIKRIPELLDNPVLVLASKGNGERSTRVVIYGSVTAENGSPVLSVLDLRPVENKLVVDDMQKVNSAYTKDNGIAFVETSNVLYADKKRTPHLLRTMGLQSRPIELQKGGFIGSITYKGQKVNITGVPFSDVFSYGSEDPSVNKELVDERHSLDIEGDKITPTSTDADRMRILSGKTITEPPQASDLPDGSDISSWDDIDSRFGKEKLALVKKLASEFGVFKDYKNADIDLSFEFSSNNFRESYSKQGRSYKRFAKMFSVFDDVVEKAVGIEAHLRDDYKPDPTLRNMYVLVSAFADGDEFIPVKMEIKEFIDKKNKLYVAVSLDGIKKTEVWKQGNTASSVTQNSRSVIISIPDLMRNVKPSDVNFTKYFPKSMLTDEQRQSLEESKDIRYSVVSAKELSSDEQRMKRMEEDRAFLEADFAKAERTSTVDERKELGADLIRRFDLDKATAPQKLRDMFLLLERYATLASASDDAQEKSTAEAEAQPKSKRTYKIGDEVQKLEEVTSQIRQISRELIAESGGLDAELLLSENDANGKEIIEEQANNLEMAAMLGYYAPVDENDTSNAYRARLSAIRKNMNMRMSRYIRRLERQANRITDLEDSAGGEKYRETIKKRTKAMRSMANNPNRKRFVEENNRETVREITDWLDRVADATTAGGVGNLETELSADALAVMEKKFLSLNDVFDEDSVDLMKMLLQQMAVNRDSYLEKEVNRELAMGRLLKTEKNLAWMMYKALRDQNRMELNGREYVANYIAGDLIESLNNRRNVEKEFNTLETGEKGKILSSSDSGKILERMEKRTRKTRKWISLNTMDGYSFLRRMGDVGGYLYKTLRAAQSEQIMHVQEYVKTLQDKLLKDQQDGAKGVDLSRYIGDKQKTVTVTLSNGEEYTMTAAQAMTIVTLYEREAGKSHIENGGVRLVHPKDKTLSAAVALKAEDVAAIEQKLDADDRRVMKVMNDFIREQCTEWGNEATLERYGFYRFNTQHYFPITVDRNALPSSVSAEGAKDYLQFNVQNVGFAKAADASAKAPVVIDSFISVINRHVEGMATYAAYLNAEDIVNRLMSAPGVKDAMQRSLGTGSVKYMTDMMTELKQGNRGGSEDALTQWWNKSAGHYKSAAVSYNLSTALKQPISIVRAAAVLDPKYILAAKRVPLSGTGKAAHEEMMQYSGIGVKKSVGYSDVGISRDINAQIGYEKKDLSKKLRNVSEFGMALAGYMDEWTWDSIWIACREEVKDKKPDLTANHEAFMNEVAKRFADVVAQTQVVDSPLDSSPLSRSKSPLARNVFAFTSEPIKGFNLLMNAMDDLINAEKGSIRQKQAAAQMARTAVITLAGWAAEASISAAFQMIRDEDDDEGELVKEFGVKFGKQMMSNAYNVVPYIGQLIDIVRDSWEGYDFTDMGIAPLVDVIDSANSVMDTLRNPENKSETIVKAGRDFVESVATFFGIPIRNFNRDVVAGLRLFFHGTDLYTAEYEMQKIFYNPKSSTAREKHEFNSLLTDAYLSGNKKAFEHIYNDMRSMGLSPQTIMNGIAKDAYAQDITSTGSTLTRYTPGSDAWYIGMKGIFDRDLTAPDGLEKELTRLYKATEEKGVLPKYKSDSYTVDGESKELSVKDHEAVLAEYSKLYYEIATILRNSPAYKNADDTLKAYWMAQAERYAGAISIYRVDREYNLRTKWWEKMKDKPYYDVAGYIITNLKPSKEDE